MKHFSKKVITPFIVTLALLAHVASAATVGPVGGPYVPVYDRTTNTNFKEYIDLFNNQFGATKPDGTTDSLRDLLSGSNPGGLAATACKKGDNLEGQKNPAFPYDEGPWRDAINATASSSSPIPDGVPEGATEDGPYVQINYSHSLRCLLQEVVEWQKLGLSLQIHALLKNYIADAQTKQLNNKLKNRVAQANLDWSRAGNEVDDGGIQSTQPVFSTNLSQSQYNVANRQLEHVTAQATADPNSGDPVGSLGIAEPWRLDVAADMVNNSRGYVEDPLAYSGNATQERLSPVLDPYDFSKFMANFNDPSNKESGMATFDAMISNKANSPLGAMDLADSIAQSRIANQQTITAQKQSNSGFIPATKCSGDPSDPYCLDTLATDVTPAGQNSENVTSQAAQGDRQIEQGDTLDAKGGPVAEQQSTQLNTQEGGLYGYDTNGLATSETTVNQLIAELYDTMYVGYFGIHEDTSRWAQATLLMIYDEMKFNKEKPEVVVTQGEDPYPTGY